MPTVGRAGGIHAETKRLATLGHLRFRSQIGGPVVVKTSCNVPGKPIVCTPEDAFRRLLGTDNEVLSSATAF